jgi:predicted transcriptional regulator
MKKVISFTIDDEILIKFYELADSMAINKSKFVENKMKEFIEANSKYSKHKTSK